LDPKDLFARLENFQIEISKELNLLKTGNPTWNAKKDVRITSITCLFSSIGRTRLALVFLTELLDDDWWQEYSPASDQEMRLDHLSWFERVTKFNLGLDFFTYTESSLRTLLRALDPTACNKGTAEFQSIYKCLIGPSQLNFIGADHTAAIQLLELSRLTRNTIHNNGAYFSKKGQDETVSYKGRLITFKHGKSIDFMYWSFLIEIAEDLHHLLYKVITHPMIKWIPEIVDPMYTSLSYIYSP
jgi:hypothetical protein